MRSWGYSQLCGSSGLLETSEDEIQVCLGLGTPNFRIPTYMGRLRSPSLEVSVARWRRQCPGLAGKGQFPGGQGKLPAC